MRIDSAIALFLISCAVLPDSLFAQNAVAGQNSVQWNDAFSVPFDLWADDRYADAVEAIKKSGIESDPRAQMIIADAYNEGNGLPKNQGFAQSMANSAIEKLRTSLSGDSRVDYLLGYAAYFGLGTEKDANSASAHFQRCLKAYPAFCGLYLAFIEGDYLSGELSGRSGSTQARFQYLVLAANAGEPNAQRLIGTLYYAGNGVEQNRAEAALWRAKAAAQGNADAALEAALQYDRADGVPQNFVEAARLYQIAVTGEKPDAMNNLAYLYSKGRGVRLDYQEALRLYRMGVEKGNPASMHNLATMYEEGYGVTRNYQTALNWYRKAIAAGSQQSDAAVANVQTKIANDREEGRQIVQGIVGAIGVIAAQDQNTTISRNGYFGGNSQTADSAGQNVTTGAANIPRSLAERGGGAAPIQNLTSCVTFIKRPIGVATYGMQNSCNVRVKWAGCRSNGVKDSCAAGTIDPGGFDPWVVLIENATKATWIACPAEAVVNGKTKTVLAFTRGGKYYCQ